MPEKNNKKLMDTIAIILCVFVVGFIFYDIWQTNKNLEEESSYVSETTGILETSEIEKIVSSEVTQIDSDDEFSTGSGNVLYPSGVTEEMTLPSFWQKKFQDEVLMSFDQIKDFNSKEKNIFDLENVEYIDPSETNVFNRQIYLDGVEIDMDEYESIIESNKEIMHQFLYAIVVNRAPIKVWPVSENLAYTQESINDEGKISILEVNSPFIISEKYVAQDGKVFYYGCSEVCQGWIESTDLAICHSRQEWLDSWKIDLTANDFIVVCQNQIIIGSPINTTLRLGTKLKIVPGNEIPYKVDNRENCLFNYYVYIPLRDEDGYFCKEIGLIPKKNKVTVGHPIFTQRNVVSVAFELLGEKFEDYNSSNLIGQIYNCFGIKMPVYLTMQTKKDEYIDISNMDYLEKIDYIMKLPVGSIFYSNGMAMIYIGYIDKTPYILASTDKFSFTAVESRTILLFSITSRSPSQRTYLEETKGILLFKKA